MAIDIESLADQAKCIQCGIPEGMQLPALIVLAAQIAGVSADPTTLIANARCVDCIPEGMQLPVLISLANQIANP